MKRARLVTLVAAAALTGCGGASEADIAGGGRVVGNAVTVYAIPTDPTGAKRDFVDGAKLALSDAGGRAGRLSVNFSALDLGVRDVEQAQASRRAISDPQIIAAIVDATDITVPLFNAAGILQVAPGGDLALARDPQLLPSGRSTVEKPKGQTPPDFAARFRSAFGREPTADAAAGYRALAGVLSAVAAAGARGTDRNRVAEVYAGS